MTDAIQVITAAASQEEAQRIARALVEQRLAACVQVAGPVRSTYRWQGQIETAEEFLCIIKSERTHYPALEKAIRELHSYEVPEILAMPIAEGSAAYLDWLRGELSAAANPHT
jgi:periplasmic divalent cation tolerance protein